MATKYRSYDWAYNFGDLSGMEAYYKGYEFKSDEWVQFMAVEYSKCPVNKLGKDLRYAYVDGFKDGFWKAKGMLSNINKR